MDPGEELQGDLSMNPRRRALPAQSANPKPFPLLNELGMVTRHDLGLSAEEFTKLVAVPTKN
jgi:hypothetical protein